MPHGDHLLISDNGDTISHLSGIGFDLWPKRQAARKQAALYGLTLTQEGDFRAVAQAKHAAFVFAKAVTGVLAVNDWARRLIDSPVAARDLAAEAEPYIIARQPEWQLERGARAIGASRTEYEFDFRHGPDLIDVVGPSPQATGGVMRKAGDVQNGPFAEGLSPLIIVDDRSDAAHALLEMSIIGSIARAMPFSRLLLPMH